MHKRRRTSSDEETEDEDDDSSSPEPSNPFPVIRKRKKLDPMELCQQLYDSIRSFKKEDGTALCDSFIRAPKRRQEPSYYEVVTNPIDLLKVQQKLKTDSYEDIEELTTDFELLVNNAKAFYKPYSIEYQDAMSLWEVFKTNKMKLLESVHEDSAASVAAGVGVDIKPRTVQRVVGRAPRKSATLDDDQISENSSENADFDQYEELFTCVMTAVDPLDNRLLHNMFQLLPSRKHYPEYYDVIEHPIDLKCIANKIQTSAYTSLNDMEKDLLQMTKNAITFNEPGSRVYKDAKMLKRIFQQRKVEIESGKSKRQANRKTRTSQSYSAITAQLKEEPESSDEEMEMDGDQSGPLWQLFDQLYNQASTSDSTPGNPLGHSLWKIPNRRFHPEYYTIVKKPISMAQIQKKLKKGDYANITDMTADLYQMLDNAKKAFPLTNKTHKDAVKMQKILNQKLVDGDMEESDDESSTSSVHHHSMTAPNSSGSIGSLGTEKKKKGRPRLHGLISSSPVAQQIMTSSGQKAYRFPNNPVLKKKLLALQKYLVDYQYDNRLPMEMFLEKPSKKLWPDYYQVIQHPIDMNTIEQNIKSDRYGTLDDVVGDFRLMFANCRKYNEEGSMIYDDANMLERVLNEKLKELSGITDRRPKIKAGRKTTSALDGKLKQLYDAIRDFKELKQGRQLALIFMKLPSKSDYPEYYDIIKSPIDMERIAIKLKQQQYETLDELAQDFMLMFDNACKFNEPDSQLYKDALLLQQVCIQTKQALRTEDENIPEVPRMVQELLMQLFTTVYNYQDEEGRCFTDSMAELPEYDDVEGTKVKGIYLDLIRRRLDKGLYKRLDQFQEDVFACLERARKLSRTDSQVFEDSIELQSYFIKQRDELCKNGDILSSPALSYSSMHLSAAVEAVRQSKLLEEDHETETDSVTTSQGESMTIDQKVYSPGDFVYFEQQDEAVPGIVYIERFWTGTDNERMCYGNVFLRPYQTYHVTSRKFLEQEVFKSDQHQAIPLMDLQQKCVVLSVKDYYKSQPDQMADKDVYVCEFRYNTKARSFKKIKTWPFQANESIKLIPRAEVLEPKRVQSVFKDRKEPAIKTDVPIDELDLVMNDKEKPNVVVFVNGGDEGNTYYEQYNTVCSGLVKTGDYVYVATESGKQAIAQISSIWETKDGKSFFRGAWLMTPNELPPATNRMVYRQEVFLSTVQETTPCVAIVGRCCVLEYFEYTTRRLTEIPESDVYLCESVYDELKKQVKKLMTPGGLKKFTHSQMVTPDEIYHFRRPINVQKVASDNPAPDIKPNIVDPDIKVEGEFVFGMDDSMDAPSVGSDFAHASSPTPLMATPISAIKRAAFTGGKSGKKVITGYILYSSEVRKAKVMDNPEMKFGEISRMIGNEWKTLSIVERQQWEERASKINGDNAIKYAEELALNPGIISPGPGGLTPSQLSAFHEFVPNQVFECCWTKCDFQFEDPGDCLEHALSDGAGCVHKYFQNQAALNEPIVYHCMWRNCIRLKRNQPPLPNLQRLVKHVREVHIVKATGKIIAPIDRSKNYLAGTRRHNITQSPQIQFQQQQQQQQQMGAVITTPITTGSPQLAYNGNQVMPQQVGVNYISQPAEPLFITVPPRPQRVLHSDAYIKYIEGLQNNSTYISNWNKTIKATKANVQVDMAKLPVSWLGKKAQDKPEEVVDALWNLRTLMWRDAFTLSRDSY